jgi:hypothetical protein
VNSFKNPLVPLIDNPVNIDRPIQEMQQALAAGLPWLAKAFGRSWESSRKDPDGRIWIYPEVWQGAGEDLLNVMPNDNLKSQCFFRVEDPIEVIDYTPDNFNFMKADVSIIFWFDLRVIDPDLDFRYTELLKGMTQRILTETSLSASGTFQIRRTWENADNVFRGYTIDKTRNQELIHPYAGFRFECDLFFYENCPNVTFVPAGEEGTFDETFDLTFD